MSEQKTKDEKINDLLVTNKNMPFPGALLKMAQGGHELREPIKPGRKLIFDEKGHPINPTNQRRYWKLVRKARRLNNSG